MPYVSKSWDSAVARVFLREARFGAGLSQREFADRAGRPPSWIGKLEAGLANANSRSSASCKGSFSHGKSI